MAEDKPAEHGPRKFAVEGNDLTGYVGVSPEYMTYAEDTHKPLKGEGDDAEDANVEAFSEQVADPSATYREQLEEAGDDPSSVSGDGLEPEAAEDEQEPTGPTPGANGQPGDPDRSDAEDADDDDEDSSEYSSDSSVRTAPPA